MKLYSVNIKASPRSPFQSVAYVYADSPKKAVARYLDKLREIGFDAPYKASASLKEELPGLFWKTSAHGRSMYLAENKEDDDLGCYAHCLENR